MINSMYDQEKTTTEETTKTKATGELHKAKDPNVSLDDLKDMVEEFLTHTQDARKLSEKCRDYKDGKQWTEEQIKELKRRKQAPVVNNRIKTKHNGLLGLFSMRKGDPKAYPRNQSKFDNGSAEAVTDGLRYAADKSKYNLIRSRLADNFFCEGYCAALVVEEVSGNGKDIDPSVDHIPWDRVIFDPYSVKSDFSDARYKGYALWMDEEDILDEFENAKEAIDANNQLATDETFEDKPRWTTRFGKRRRHLVATLYFKKKKVHYVAIFTGGGILLKPQPSTYLDENGEPECPIIMEHAYIDRDNNRYGELAAFLDLQDEINHRRSKALFLLSQRQTFGTRGAIKDVKAAKRELAKPDGHLEVDVGEFGKDFGILPTGDLAQGQVELLMEAKQEMDAQSYNAQLAGERGTGDLSGVAIGKLQNSGIIELNDLFDRLAAFELRIYTQMWNRIRQFWTEEKWVRVTDDQKSLKFVGFNVPVTLGEMLTEIMDDESKPKAMRLGAAAQMNALEQENPQILEELVETRNNPAELDMDIILDQSYDSVNASQEQLDIIIKFGAQQAFDIIDLLSISNIQGKDKLIEKIEARRKEAANAGPDPEAKLNEAKTIETMSKVEVNKQTAIQTAMETELLKRQTAIPFQGSIRT